MSPIRLAGLLASVAACSPPNTLQGSLGELVDLTFEKVEVQASSNLLLIQYQHTPHGGGLEVPFQLELTPPPGQPLADGVQLDLSKTDADGNPLVSTSREAPNDPRHTLPPIKLGTLTLTSNFAPGSTASGQFHILFGTGGDVGEGRTVDGTFSVTAQAPSNQGSNP
jgi:hypothetical protein